MKKTIKFSMIILISLLFVNCMKENHSIRVKNEYNSQLNNIVIGSADIGSVSPGSTSDYKSINTGDFNISGTTSNGQTLTGSGTISGKGEHKWTFTIDSGGQTTIKEDK